MQTGRFTVIVWLVVVLLGLHSAPAMAAVSLKDIGANWAREHIEALVNMGVVSGYPDQSFRPDHSVTRGEFAKMITTAFTIIPERDVRFTDVANHWAREHILALAGAGIADGYHDGSFRPNNKITRAEAVSMLIRVLRLHDVKGYSDTPSFVDVHQNHWAYPSIESALRLKILPPYIRGSFEPDLPVTRAETAAMINESLRLQITRGTIDYLEPEFNLVGVRHQGGVNDFTLHPQTVIYRNTAVAPFGNLEVGDAVYVVADRFGSPQIVKANGVVTPNDVVTKVSIQPVRHAGAADGLRRPALRASSCRSGSCWRPSR